MSERAAVVDLLVMKSGYNHQDAMFVVGWLCAEAPDDVLEQCLLALHATQREKGRYDVEAAFAERFKPMPGR